MYLEKVHQVLECGESLHIAFSCSIIRRLSILRVGIGKHGVPLNTQYILFHFDVAAIILHHFFLVESYVNRVRLP